MNQATPATTATPLKPPVGTLGYDQLGPAPAAVPPAPAPALAAPAVTVTAATVAAGDSLALDATSVSPATGLPAQGAATATTQNPFRTTVLPRLERVGAEARFVRDARPRYQKLRALGEGGVGEVTLAQDHDIDRKVAVKRLRAEHVGDAMLVRFAEEVRTVGRLEHPNIAPIHDVGIDEDGQHFFVMKYVEGETLEGIITKLTAGDPEYVRRYTFAYRRQIFVAVLRAIQYAHAHGVIHRDLKPANIMVGPYGEVMVMDWGLAKQIRNGPPVNLDALGGSPAEPAPADDAPGAGGRERLFKTRHGALLGTPAYMSPEQARGQNDQLDERSDVYSLCVVFLEFLSLRHYLADCDTIPAMLNGVLERPFGRADIHALASACGVPCELLYTVEIGLAKDPAARYPTVDALLTRLENIADGEVAVQCPVTFMKRSTHEWLHFLDRFPRTSMVLVSSVVVLSVVEAVSLALRLVH